MSPLQQCARHTAVS